MIQPEHRDQSPSWKPIIWQYPDVHMTLPSESATAHHRLFSLLAWGLPISFSFQPGLYQIIESR